MKLTNSASGKGILDLDFSSGKATLTFIKKNEELQYDFFELLERFNGKMISFSITETNEAETIVENGDEEDEL